MNKLLFRLYDWAYRTGSRPLRWAGVAFSVAMWLTFGLAWGVWAAVAVVAVIIVTMVLTQTLDAAITGEVDRERAARTQRGNHDG